jgi:putative tricarboxylic transport membrane protein
MINLSQEEQTMFTRLQSLFGNGRHWVVFLVMCLSCGYVQAQSWSPEKNVEIIAGGGPGSAFDRTARVIQSRFQTLKLVDSSSVVINRVGGGGTAGWTYLKQFTGDGHRLAVTVPNLLTNYITGNTTLQYTELTPIAQLFDEYVVLVVKADSPIKDGKALIEQFRKDPRALSISVGTGLGNANHIAVAQIAKASGVDVKQLKTVVFNSAGEASAALLGGHIDLASSAANTMVSYLQSGTMRALAINAPQRLPGPLAGVPTWKEQGLPVVLSSFRGVIAPGGLSPAQIAYWEGVFLKLSKSEDWNKELEQNAWVGSYTGSAGSRAYLKAQEDLLRGVLSELGMAKR